MFFEVLADASLRTRLLLHVAADKRFAVDGREAEICCPAIRRRLRGDVLRHDARRIVVRQGGEWHQAHGHGSDQYSKSFGRVRHLEILQENSTEIREVEALL